jgi:hypothetical protein
VQEAFRCRYASSEHAHSRKGSPIESGTSASTTAAACAETMGGGSPAPKRLGPLVEIGLKSKPRDWRWKNGSVPGKGRRQTNWPQ